MSDQMNEVQVTVWCLAYNHEKYIRKALEGFVSQKTTFKYEVIVHDDASTDGTVDIIKEFEEKYPDIIKPIYQKENQTQKGIDKMKEFLLPNAKGKYIAFCEGDDYWCSSEKLQKQYDIMNNDEHIELCVHKVQCVNEDDSYNSRVIPEDVYQLHDNQELSQELFSKLLFIKPGYPFHTSSYFIKKKLLESPIFYELYLRMNGDLRVLYTALALGNVYYINDSYSHRRLLTAGNWNQRFLKMSSEDKILHFTKQINGLIIFDEITSKKYQKQIAHSIFKFLVGLSIDYGVKVIVPYRKDVEKKYNIKMVESLNMRCRYYLLKYAPILLTTMVRLKRALVSK